MKKEIQRMFSALLSIALLLSLCPAAFATNQTITEDDYSGKTVILHSNDVHGEIMGYAYMAALKTDFEAKGADVILADAGDFSQGDPTVSLSKGADAVAMMNATGYDVATLGNHEFDYGYAQLKQNLENAEFNVICADVLKGDKTIYDPTWMYDNNEGLKIGFFGMETPETQTKVNPGLIQGIHFLSKGEIYTCAQEQIDALRKDGADVVIALAHLGVDAESAPDGHRSVDMYHNTQGIDLILDGHSHTVMTEGENGEPVQSTGTKFANIGVVVIDEASEKIESHYLLPTEGMEKDSAVAEKAQEIIDRVDAEYGTVFAKSEIYLNGERAPGNRTQETNLGDLITDAIVWKVLKEDGALTVDEDHVVGITNGGGIRASIQAGDVTRKDLNTVLPFGNTVAVVYVTGTELLEALEASTYAAPEALGGYPQTFGIEFTLDTTKAFDQGEAYPESTYYKPASIQRVTITAINGEPFDPAATYAVVTNDFCAAGGDTYYAFKAASAQFDTGIVMDEAVMEYVAEALGDVISSETYGEPRGDQNIITPPYSVTVTGGTGGGEYTVGKAVTLTANEPESGKRFKEWTGVDELTFTSGSATETSITFYMPAKELSLTAVYEDIPVHEVTVTDGEGTGTYEEGASVSIQAKDAPEGQVFSRWMGAEGLTFTSGSQNSANATFIMPDKDVTLTAAFKEPSQGGCYVATSVYGSYDCPEVWTLRRFRDNVLAKTWYGRLFIRLYYAVSPTAVKLFGDCAWFQNFFRDKLDTMVAGLQADGFESTPYQDRAW